MKPFFFFFFFLFPACVSAFYGGECRSVLYFDRCSSLTVNIMANDTIVEGEYWFDSCTRVFNDSWSCSCYDNYDLVMCTDAGAVNSYYITVSYQYGEFVADTGSTSRYHYSYDLGDILPETPISSEINTTEEVKVVNDKVVSDVKEQPPKDQEAIPPDKDYYWLWLILAGILVVCFIYWLIRRR